MMSLEHYCKPSTASEPKDLVLCIRTKTLIKYSCLSNQTDWLQILRINSEFSVLT